MFSGLRSWWRGLFMGSGWTRLVGLSEEDRVVVNENLRVAEEAFDSGLISEGVFDSLVDEIMLFGGVERGVDWVVERVGI